MALKSIWKTRTRLDLVYVHPLKSINFWFMVKTWSGLVWSGLVYLFCIGATICIGREIECRLYAGFFLHHGFGFRTLNLLMCADNKKN